MISVTINVAEDKIHVELTGGSADGLSQDPPQRWTVGQAERPHLTQTYERWPDCWLWLSELC